MTAALFPLGHIVATPGALEVMERLDVTAIELLIRHVSGDWGDIDPADRRANASALRHGERILSSYGAEPDRIWIISEADRASTCILLPSDY